MRKWGNVARNRGAANAGRNSGAETRGRIRKGHLTVSRQQRENDLRIKFHLHDCKERRTRVLKRRTDMPGRVVRDDEAVVRLLVALCPHHASRVAGQSDPPSESAAG